ncbi:MAG: hypothetical protein IPJ77_13700 [Planctomycetes bacterium]|nr:hypothetical protein [Planctomycetota bacterium]
MLPTELGTPGQRPRVETACVVNVLPDHLERHGSLENYADAKKRILELALAAGGTAVLPAEDRWTSSWRIDGLRRVDAWFEREDVGGLHFEDGRFHFDAERLGRVDELRIPGTFQRNNTLLALGMARLLGADPARLAAAIPELRGLPHRLEDLGLFEGHRVIDNGVSTTPDSTLSAVLSMRPGFTLLVGGKAKDLPVDELAHSCRGRVRSVIVFGAAGPVFAPAFERAGVEVHTEPSVEAAVARAFETMLAGEELLFSPACASFDAYLNFRERALAFRAALPHGEAS